MRCLRVSCPPCALLCSDASCWPRSSCSIPSTAAADITAFLGVNPTPSNRTLRGLAIGAGLLVVGIEFEYADTSEDAPENAPGLRTVMINGLVQTPFPIGGMQFYGTAGVGGYRETLREVSETSVGMNVGGGVKMNLIGPAAPAARLPGVHAARGSAARRGRSGSMRALNLRF
jgi:hypothetical protein